jgi:peptidoglycan-N-acetylglucosamine deacetylase
MSESNQSTPKSPTGVGMSRAIESLDRPSATEEVEAAALSRRIGDRLLRRPRIVYRGKGLRGEVALTFDDGPSRWTAEIAAILEEHGCRATFFLRGPAVEQRPADVAALAAAGHELGNHLWSHSDATSQGRAEIRAELEHTADVVRAAGGGRPTLIRPPYLKGPHEVATAARGSDARAIVLRSIAVSDWAAASAEEIYEPVLAGAGRGDIVCLHDGISSDKRDTDSREPTATAVRQLVPALLERSLKPVTVSRLLR